MRLLLLRSIKLVIIGLCRRGLSGPLSLFLALDLFGDRECFLSVFLLGLSCGLQARLAPQIIRCAMKDPAPWGGFQDLVDELRPSQISLDLRQVDLDGGLTRGRHARDLLCADLVGHIDLDQQSAHLAGLGVTGVAYQIRAEAYLRLLDLDPLEAEPARRKRHALPAACVDGEGWQHEAARLCDGRFCHQMCIGLTCLPALDGGSMREMRDASATAGLCDQLKAAIRAGEVRCAQVDCGDMVQLAALSSGEDRPRARPRLRHHTAQDRSKRLSQVLAAHQDLDLSVIRKKAIGVTTIPRMNGNLGEEMSSPFCCGTAWRIIGQPLLTGQSYQVIAGAAKPFHRRITAE